MKRSYKILLGVALLSVVLIQACSNLPAFVLGVDIAPLAVFILGTRLYTVLLHANIDLTYGPLDRVFASPRFHHWHHAADGTGTHHNFAGLFSLFDWLLGTWHPTAEAPLRLGNPNIPGSAEETA